MIAGKIREVVVPAAGFPVGRAVVGGHPEGEAGFRHFPEVVGALVAAVAVEVGKPEN